MFGEIHAFMTEKRRVRHTDRRLDPESHVTLDLSSQIRNAIYSSSPVIVFIQRRH